MLYNNSSYNWKSKCIVCVWVRLILLINELSHCPRIKDVKQGFIKISLGYVLRENLDKLSYSNKYLIQIYHKLLILFHFRSTASLPLQNPFASSSCRHTFLNRVRSLSLNGTWLVIIKNITFGHVTAFILRTAKFLIHMYLHNWSLQPFKSGLRPSFSHHWCCVC